ncbi:MAG: hypothetical protein ABSB76_23660 [Streptosporangiaceae bacterium]
MQWQAAIGEGLRRLDQAGQHPAGTAPDARAVTLRGGLLLAQVQRDARLPETAAGTLLELARSSRPHSCAGSGEPGRPPEGRPSSRAAPRSAR